MTAGLWLAAFVAVNLADAALTLVALKIGGAEANPLLRALMRRVHPALVLVLVKGAYIVAVAVWWAQAAPWLPAATGIFAAICAWNAWQIVRARR